MAPVQKSNHRGKQRDGHSVGRASVALSNSFASLDNNGEMNADLTERFRGSTRYPNTHNALSSALDTGLDLTLNLDIRNYVSGQERIQSTTNEAWLSQPEIPTKEELSSEINTLLPNKIDRPFKSKDRYLTTHYGLLREDAIGSLREAVLDFSKDPATGDTSKYSVYDQCHIVGLTFARRGLAARVKFSTQRAGKRINWATSKRLVSGSIIVLIPAKTRTIDLNEMIVATVAARPLAGVNCSPPEIDIYFGRSDDIQLDPQKEWLMLEAKQGYFEAYRHTLRALQKLGQETFPMSEIICRLSNTNETPEYVKEKPILDISAAAVDPDQKKDYSSVNVTGDWPPAPANSLDDTQWEALKEILTRRLAIVQGPPGTGKTYVSKVLLEILHANRTPNDPPIIIAAQTNHALDQLLVHVSLFEPNYIRLGGRSTNPEVKKRALFEIRQNERMRPIPGGMLGKSNSFLTKETNALIQILEPLVMPGPDLWSTDQVSGPKTLHQLGVLTSEQAKSLEDGATQWVSATASVEGALRLWLDTALLPFEVDYAKDSYGFEEVDDDDLEFEQLREREDSNGINDEEDVEMLKGPWRELRDRFMVAEPSLADSTTAARLLEKSADLWQIPEYFRGPVYHIMQSRAKAKITAKFREAAKSYNKIVQDILVGKWEQDAVFLQRASVIGLTTTGLSKYRPLISALKPKVILIEEAAEVLEAPVTVACVETLEHLILVGDHQQLQGHCSVSELENEPFFLNVSLFERLVRNDMPYKTLLQQRRMMPEFRRLISGLYPKLTDHPSVADRRVEPWGMELRSFFFDHDWWEAKDQSLSTFNPEEARFIAGFYRYLLKNGVTHDRITVLTFYNGQRKRILRELKEFEECKTYVNVKTVDSFQGEEADIILLSLARNNQENKIGFLENINRTCVALSRAKHGFYIFGNAQILMRNSALWCNVITLMESRPRRLDNGVLPIRCQKHGRTVMMEYPDDWEKTDGGCLSPCQSTLACGHICPLQCHPYSHDRVICKEDCSKTLFCGHGCYNKCSEPCFCTCKDFAAAREEGMRAKSSSSVIEDANGVNQDIRVTQGNGQDHPVPGSASYLPQQTPTPEDEKWHVRPSNWGPSDNLRNATEQRSLRTGYRPATGGTWNRAPQDTITSNPLSMEIQGQLQKGWKNFAGGGFVAHDERLSNLISAPVAQPLFNVGYGTKGDVQVSRVGDEAVQVMSNGRLKFTEIYQPGGSPNKDITGTRAPPLAGGGVSATPKQQQRSSPGEARSNKKKAQPSSTTKVGPSNNTEWPKEAKSSALDDLRELDGCFSDH